MKSWIFACLTIAAAGVAGAQVSPGAVNMDRPTSTMTPSEIKAHNASLPKGDPNIITCRREPVIGSLAKKLRVCRTQTEWAAYSAQGSRTAQELYDQVGRVQPSGN